MEAPSTNSVEQRGERRKGSSPISFGSIHENNLEQLRLLNTIIFPVKYNDKFYTDILTTPPDFTKYGTKLLKSALTAVPKHPDLDEIYLHVQTSNQDAINFYAKHGFEIKDMIKNYYKRIEPPDCYVLSKTLRMGEEPAGQESA